jgi:hemoglobin
MSDPTAYDRLGGDDGVRALVDRFYDLMDNQQSTQAIRAMHPDDLTESRRKLYQFLSGWLGGPQLYVQEHGHPRLRGRHMPFPIDSEAARQWMVCMIKSLDEQVPDKALRDSLKASFVNVAAHMRNRSDPPAPAT